jgi:hypothetical protein
LLKQIDRIAGEMHAVDARGELTEAGKSPGQNSEHHGADTNDADNDKQDKFSAGEPTPFQGDRCNAQQQGADERYHLF